MNLPPKRPPCASRDPLARWQVRLITLPPLAILPFLHLSGRQWTGQGRGPLCTRQHFLHDLARAEAVICAAQADNAELHWEFLNLALSAFRIACTLQGSAVCGPVARGVSR
jgi:hypothetical protein